MTFPQPQMLDCNGVSLEVFMANTPAAGESGRPIVLCHGWPEHAYSWRYQIPFLAELGYHVIVPNQRGYGNSSRPTAVSEYDADHLTADLTSLLDHFGYDEAIFVGHDWGAINVWNLALLDPQRVKGIINLSVPFLPRGSQDWVSQWEELAGGDFYIVHFNRQPGVAAAVFDEHRDRFLRNMYRTKQWEQAPVALGDGMALINIAQREDMPGDALMSDADLAVLANAFEQSGFTGGINWYRNFIRNWNRLAQVPERVEHPTLMIHGQYDMVPASENIAQYVPNVEVNTLPCGHWIQQEQPDQTNALMGDWLSTHG